MTLPGATLPKKERLSGTTAIAFLMSKGKWGVHGHFRYCVLPNQEDVSRIIANVPKKFFKRAVKRNLLKRRTREAYRTQKELCPRNCDILFSYNSPELADWATIKAEIAEILRKI